MPRSVDRFNSQIQKFQQTRTGNEKAGRISQREMKDALAEIAPGDSGQVSASELKAAKDLFASNVDMTRGGRELLKSFIEQFSSSPAQHGTGLRQLETPDEVRHALQDAGTLDGVMTHAFGNLARSRSLSREVGEIRKLPSGNFEVDVRLSHWRTGQTHKSATVEMNPAGALVDRPPLDPAPAVDPRDAKITADGPIGGGRVFKVRADDPIPGTGGTGRPDPIPPQPAPRDNGGIFKIRADDPIDPIPPQPAPGGPGDNPDIVKVRADDPIGDPVPPQPAPGGPGDDIFKVRADDPIGDPVPPQPAPGDDIVKVRADDPIGDTGPDPIPPQPAPFDPNDPNIFKVRADDPIPDVSDANEPDPIPPQPAPRGPGGRRGPRVFKITADDPT